MAEGNYVVQRKRPDGSWEDTLWTLPITEVDAYILPVSKSSADKALRDASTSFPEETYRIRDITAPPEDSHD